MDDNKVAVLLEDLRAQFRTFGEGLAGLREEMKEFREETNNRFDNLESQNLCKWSRNLTLKLLK